MTYCGRLGGQPALLQVRMVDSAVDHSPDLWGVQVYTFPGRPSGRPDPITVDRAVDRLTDPNSLFGPVDRAVDRLCYRSYRSTAVLTHGGKHVCTFLGRPGGRPDPMTVDRAVDRLTDPNSQFGTVDWAVDRSQPTS